MEKVIDDPEEVIGVLVRRAASNALFHLTEIDTSLVSVLHELGLLKGVETDSEAVSTVVEVLSDSTHEQRIDAGAGPVLALSRSSSARSIVYLTEHFSEPDQNLRKALLNYFEELDASCDCLMQASRQVIAENREKVISAADWLDAALAIQDVLTDDFFLNRLGLCQCLALGYDVGAERYLSRLLRPELVAIDSLSLQILREQESAEALVSSLRWDESEVRSGLDTFFSSFGYLPFGRYALYDFLSPARLADYEPKELWTVLWEWAKERASPLAAYHVIIFYAVYPNLIPEREIACFWSRLEDIVEVDQTGNSSRGKAWLLRSELARHYCCYLETRVVNNDGSKVAGFSWWLAENVADVVDWERPGRAAVNKSALERNFMRSRFEWSLLRLPVSSSCFRFCTLILGDCWSVSLLTILGRNISRIKPSELGPEREKLFSQELIRHLIRSVHLISENASPQSVVVGRRILETAIAWASELSDGESRAEIETFIDILGKVGEGTADHLRALPKADGALQILLANAVRMRAYTSDDLSGLLWPHIQNEIWIRQVLESPHGDLVLETLFDAMIEIQGKGEDEWRVALPHLFARMCEEDVEDKSVWALLARLVVMTSVSGQTVSAIRRLRNNQLTEDSVAALIYIQKQLAAAVREGTPWLVSRIRPVLAELGRFEFITSENQEEDGVEGPRSS